jgi:ketosteroid isomerase-like protein
VATEHEQLVRDWADAFNRGDMDAVLELIHPEIEIEDPERTGRTWRGHDEYRAFIDEWLENFDSYSVKLAELEQGPNGTYVRGTQSGKGAGSGLEFALPINYVVRFRDGKVVYFRLSTDPETTRRVAGLEA